jgi:hypothetical protein
MAMSQLRHCLQCRILLLLLRLMLLVQGVALEQLLQLWKVLLQDVQSVQLSMMLQDEALQIFSIDASISTSILCKQGIITQEQSNAALCCICQ